MIDAKLWHLIKNYHINTIAVERVDLNAILMIKYMHAPKSTKPLFLIGFKYAVLIKKH